MNNRSIIRRYIIFVSTSIHVLTKRFQLSSLDIYNMIQGDTALFFISSTDVNEFLRGRTGIFYYLFRLPAQGRNRAEKFNLMAIGYKNETGNSGQYFRTTVDTLTVTFLFYFKSSIYICRQNSSPCCVS